MRGEGYRCGWGYSSELPMREFEIVEKAAQVFKGIQGEMERWDRVNE